MADLTPPQGTGYKLEDIPMLTPNGEKAWVPRENAKNAFDSGWKVDYDAIALKETKGVVPQESNVGTPVPLAFVPEEKRDIKYGYTNANNEVAFMDSNGEKVWVPKENAQKASDAGWRPVEFDEHMAQYADMTTKAGGPGIPFIGEAAVAYFPGLKAMAAEKSPRIKVGLKAQEEEFPIATKAGEIVGTIASAVSGPLGYTGKAASSARLSKIPELVKSVRSLKIVPRADEALLPVKSGAERILESAPINMMPAPLKPLSYFEFKNPLIVKTLKSATANPLFQRLAAESAVIAVDSEAQESAIHGVPFSWTDVAGKTAANIALGYGISYAANGVGFVAKKTKNFVANRFKNEKELYNLKLEKTKLEPSVREVEAKLALTKIELEKATENVRLADSKVQGAYFSYQKTDFDVKNRFASWLEWYKEAIRNQVNARPAAADAAEKYANILNESDMLIAEKAAVEGGIEKINQAISNKTVSIATDVANKILFRSALGGAAGYGVGGIPGAIIGAGAVRLLTGPATKRLTYNLFRRQYDASGKFAKYINQIGEDSGNMLSPSISSLRVGAFRVLDKSSADAIKKELELTDVKDYYASSFSGYVSAGMEETDAAELAAFGSKILTFLKQNLPNTSILSERAKFSKILNSVSNLPEVILRLESYKATNEDLEVLKTVLGNNYLEIQRVAAKSLEEGDLSVEKKDFLKKIVGSNNNTLFLQQITYSNENKQESNKKMKGAEVAKTPLQSAAGNLGSR
jgi:hypothetical protein